MLLKQKTKPVAANRKSSADPEAEYVYQPYPKMLYKVVGGKVTSKTVETKEGHDALLEEGWAESPADLKDDKSATDADQIEELKADRAILLEEVESLKKQLEEAGVANHTADPAPTSKGKQHK